MKNVATVIMGLFSSGLTYLIGRTAWFAVAGTEIGPLSVSGIILLFGGCAASVYALQRNAKTASKILARGFLLAAAEWLVLIGIGILGALYIRDGGGVIKSVMMAFVSLFMSLACLAGFAIIHYWRRE